jgi:putative salt-induced outer membrane protein YdiY
MKILILIFTCLLSFSSVTLYAQISGSASARNIMVKNSRVSKAKLSVQMTVEGNYQTGNTEKANLSGTGYMAAIDSLKEFSANGRFIYGENNKTVNQREFLAGVQYDYHPLSSVSPFVRVEFYRNQFKMIDGRYCGFVGAKYRYFVRPDKFDYSISAAVLYDLEHYAVDADLPGKERIRLSVRPKFKHVFTENIHVNAELFYKPNVVNFSDYMIYGICNLNIRIIRHTIVRVSYEHEYNSIPATNKVKNTDSLLLAGLGIEF